MTTSKLRTGTRLSIEEFMELPDTDDRRKMELDDGELYIMPRPRPVHGFIQNHFIRIIGNFFEFFDDPPADFFSDIIVALPSALSLLLAPDLCIILRERTDIIGPRMIEGAPDIVIEILSSDRRRDLGRKRQLYAEAGILEYWIVDPRNDTVTLLELHGGEYTERAVLNAADTLTTPLLPGLAILLADIFRHPRRPAGG